MMIQKATERRSARAAHEAEGRVNGAGAGGSRPLATNDFPPAGEAGGKIINGFIMIDPITGR